MNLQKLRLGQLKPADGSTTVGDVYFPQTSLLLPFDGSDAATSTSDLSNRNGTVSFAGTAQLSTGQSKFGGSSLLLDGNSDYVSISDSYWNTAFDSGDFTVECWVRFDSGVLDGSTAVEFMATRGNSGGSSTNGWGLRKYNDNFIAWYMRMGSSWVYLNYSQGTKTTVSADTWYHVAVTRSGNTWKLFLNGTAEDTITNSGSITSANGDRFVIGALAGGNFSADLYMDGYIEDVRVTIGHARYTSNFTAPTTAHLTSAGDVNKHIVVNSDADGVAIGTGGISQARIAKAWVHFDGTEAAGDMIGSSYNVSSMTDHGTGRYTVNFATALTDANYSAVMYTNAYDSDAAGGFNNHFHGGLNTRTTTSVRLEAYNSTAYPDASLCDVIVFGN
jgi:hypothetical protein